MTFVAGIDIGSLTAKIVVLDTSEDTNKVLFSQLAKVGYSPGNISNNLIEKAESCLNGEKINYIVSTGYGRQLVVKANKRITEITCHAVGAYHSDPAIHTIIDIGGQDSKVIRVNDQGQVQDFEMNDKCSAGSGRFLEVMADALEVTIEKFGSLGLKSNSPSKISSTCTVFAESEVISRINQGADRNDIIAGIHEYIVNKIVALASRVGIQPEVSLTGGVALNPAVRSLLEREFEVKLRVPEEPQMNGAYGAAILASNYCTKLG